MAEVLASESGRARSHELNCVNIFRPVLCSWPVASNGGGAGWSPTETAQNWTHVWLTKVCFYLVSDSKGTIMRNTWEREPELPVHCVDSCRLVLTCQSSLREPLDSPPPLPRLDIESRRLSTCSTALASTSPRTRCRTWCLRGSERDFSGWCGFSPSPSPLTLTTRLQPPAKILRQRGLGFQSVLPILSLVGLFACEHGAHLRSRRSTPRGHTLEKEELRRISEKANYSDYDYVSCWFGKAYRKPQRLRSNWPALAMGCMCMVLRSRPHEILEGKVRVDRDGRQQWFWKTTLAGA